MEIIKVDSTVLEKIAYDSDAEILYIRFRHGGDYSYSGVGRATYAALIAAESKGKYFRENIMNQFRTERLN